MLKAYKKIKLSAASLAMIAKSNEIIAGHNADGFSLTLRQLYYQLVTKNLIPNTKQSYKTLGVLISKARLAGLIDWNAIEDRIRSLQRLSVWDGPADIIESCIASFRMDKWKNQPRRVEVWIEKDALAGVIEGVCNEYEVPFFACRGYASQSSLHEAAMRHKRYKEGGQEPLVIYLGDHDPSGKDITRDIRERFELFMGGVEVIRIALNMDQIRQYNPPPNPAKEKDARYKEYVRKHGKKCWELDALEPKVISRLVARTILKYRDEKKWGRAVAAEEPHKEKLQDIADDLRE